MQKDLAITSDTTTNDGLGSTFLVWFYKNEKKDKSRFSLRSTIYLRYNSSLHLHKT